MDTAAGLFTLLEPCCTVAGSVVRVHVVVSYIIVYGQSPVILAQQAKHRLPV